MKSANDSIMCGFQYEYKFYYFERALKKLRFEPRAVSSNLQQPPYSPDLPPADFYSFPELNTYTEGS